MTTEPEQDNSMRQIRISFGQLLVLEHLDDPMSEAEFEHLMRDYFASLRATGRPAPAVVGKDAVHS